jgi:FKBP-type peptidyl-prolyl cis-trans isomerase SlyD
MKIAPGVAVEIEYELKVKGGAVIESSERTGRLRYVHGDGKMLPGLEKRLEGLGPGDEAKGEIPARAVFEAKDPTSGAPIRFKMLTVEADVVKVRLLHPLVGQDLEYQVRVIAVRDPSVRGVPPPAPGVVELDTDEIQEV